MRNTINKLVLAAMALLAGCGKTNKGSVFVKDDGCIYYKGKKVYTCAWRRMFTRENKMYPYDDLDKCMSRAESVAANSRLSPTGIFISESGRRVEVPACTEITKNAGFAYNYDKQSGIVLVNNWSGTGKDVQTVRDAYRIEFLPDGVDVKLVRSDVEVLTEEQKAEKRAAYEKWKARRAAEIREHEKAAREASKARAKAAAEARAAEEAAKKASMAAAQDAGKNK
ncbi:MAG: hypothetical protein LBO78_03180 [Rickettsiales bacterium]|jgi:hypothetical protein|nr:hypothetical protein [Rickettsiales bacterium]